MTEERYDVFKAISEPTRRKLIQLLVTSGALSLTAIAANFDISRQAVNKHIAILEKAGLLHIYDTGRERYCKAEFGPLKEVFDWVSFYEKFWDQKLDALDDYIKNKKK